MIWTADHKIVELRRKLSSIEEELNYWCAQTSKNGPLPKHHSQVLRVSRRLRVLTRKLAEWIATLEHDANKLVQEGRDVELMILDIHRIWDFFRSKLAQRYVGHFQDYLVVADEFAWSCYSPAIAAAESARTTRAPAKEPPLVFLNGGWSPYTVSRGEAFEAEWVGDDDILSADFLEVLDDLPITVIGIPWFQIRHLPDALVIGHEVGHAVEDDFDLSTTLEAALEACLRKRRVVGDRTRGWRAWRGELFADCYGILAGGPSFVSSLMDCLALSSEGIVTAVQSDSHWEPHPPETLRILFNVHVLRALGFPAQARDLEEVWRDRFPSHAMMEFEDDIGPIADTLLGVKYPQFGKASLPEVISFGDTQIAEADATQLSLKQGLTPTGSIRGVLAGARCAFESDPAGFFNARADEVVVARIRAERSGETRGEDAETPESADSSAGEELFEQLKSQRRRRRQP
ncbi:MAG: hypothetical protein JO057_09120 [Chloroflexi bacterium]|nr:hypothetical protein [Chloroflexota bacterium]